MSIIAGTSVGGSSTGWQVMDPAASPAALGMVHDAPAPPEATMAFGSGGEAGLGAWGVGDGSLAGSMGTVGGSWSPEPLGNNQILYGHYSAQGLLALPNSTAASFAGSTPAMHQYGAPAATAATAGGGAGAAAPVGGRDRTPAARPAATTKRAPAATAPARPEAAGAATVKRGDSLSKLAAANGSTWQKLYELNRDVIGSNPNLIRPGQKLKLA